MSDITAVIPTSAIKSHPDTRIIDETIASIRYHLPDAEIILTFDGLHPNYEHYRERYDEYKTKMLWRCLHEYKNVLPLVFDEHVHQSGMMQEAIKHIKTPLILYMEHDAPLTVDRKIDWQKCIDFIMDGEANTIRFHFEEVIPREHEGLMLGAPKDGFLKTIQWSQRPHLSTKLYYEELLKFFPVNAKTFIEDEWHGVVMNDWNRDGKLGWYKHRLWIYHQPDSLGIKRSYTTDGREGDAKVGEGIQR